ncbi:MAG: hypothetical protein VXW32_16575 [Myxococcota bacterium]|nr:hypothetical protein [Myxococcota bacterium]
MGLSLLKSGSGPDVVLVPGLQGDPGVFRPLVSCLQDYRIWGFRLSRGGLDQDATVLHRSMERQGVERPRLVAGSYGGQVGLRLNGPLHSLVLVGSFGRWEQVPRKRRMALRWALRMPEGLLERRYNATLVSRLVADGVPREVAESLHGPGGRALRTRLRSLVGAGGSMLAQPTLWIAGVEDAQAPWSHEAMRRVWPRVVSQRLPGRHRPYASHPEEFASALKSWWDSVDAEHQQGPGS